MSLWGCQVGSQFLQCAGTLYTLQERLLLGGLLIVMVSVAAFVVVRLVNPN
jgi:hypothetical protein